MYVVGVPPVLPEPEEDETVTALVFVTPLNDALMVADPLATPVTVKLVLAFPGDTTALEPTVATEEEDDESAMVVFADTALLIVAENTCVFPGANVTVEGDKELKTGVLPDEDEIALTYKWSQYQCHDFVQSRYAHVAVDCPSHVGVITHSSNPPGLILILKCDVESVPSTQICIIPSRDVPVVEARKRISTLCHPLPAANVATALLMFGLNHPVPSVG